MSTRWVSGGVRRTCPGPCTSRLPSSSILATVYGILGGTFDPPHLGHLALAYASLKQLELTEIQFVPAGDPWQKAGLEITDARLRLAMTHLAAAEHARFVVNDAEIHRSGPTYTIDTIAESDGRAVLILGSDAAAGIPTWHRAEELLAAVEIAVVERPGNTIKDVEDAIGKTVLQIAMPSTEVSSTEIRAFVAAGHSPRFLVPDAVADFIAANGLYR